MKCSHKKVTTRLSTCNMGHEHEEEASENLYVQTSFVGNTKTFTCSQCGAKKDYVYTDHEMEMIRYTNAMQTKMAKAIFTDGRG